MSSETPLSRHVLITGATGYLGRAMAHGFADAGWTVHANARSQGPVDDLVASLRATDGRAEAAVFDVADAAAVAAYFSGFEGPLHALVNNAYTGGAGTIQTAETAEYNDAFAVGVTAPHTLLRHALPAMRQARAAGQDASVVNLASMYGLVAPDLRVYASPAVANPPFYGAAKAALVQWTRYAAVELGPEGIRVNALTPGPFPQEPVRATNPELVSRLIDRVPLGRVGEAAEITAPVLFLTSPGATFVTGTNLVVDGGWTAW
ncbi:SDR family oxidoreductase [Mumia sp. zg.B21]|uniref:SDR family NAD(P)-dependent oxidoreductase n=1 Tax=Mumia sp. zg.B21 TaxID=2855447 RepID=UPI001C6F5765|nr:SDR family oxidoreductase [Mumia sp. zg.B21]MBW9209518.1 SDR family oxidoreductase [Mumia sp. zg.B21]